MDELDEYFYLKSFLLRMSLSPAAGYFSISKLSKVFQASNIIEDADVIAKTDDLRCMRKPL